MKKVKISQANDLGRVLTLDEMKSIFGGTRASVTCTCTLTITYKDNHGVEHSYNESAHPYGDFFTKEECKEACQKRCSLVKDCSESYSHYKFDEGGSLLGSY